MKLKKLPLLSAMFLATGWATVSAAPTEYKIPATQEEFEANWEVIPGEGTDTWTWHSDAVRDYASVPPVASVQAATTVSATLILAEPIEMKAGDIYYVSALVASADFNDDERFYVVYSTDKENWNILNKNYSAFYIYAQKNVTDPFEYRPNDSNSSYRMLTAPEDGSYYIGVRSWYASGNYASKALKFAGFQVEKAVNHPQSVSGLKVTVFPEGEMGATIEWKNPTKNKGGDAIEEKIGVNIYRATENSKAVLYNEAALIATINDLEPGATCSFVDNAENSAQPLTEAGKYYYHVAPFNSNGEYSECASASYTQSKWIGEDVEVYAPLNVAAVAVDDNVELSFTKRTDGKNSGWIDPAKLKHIIERKKDSGEYVVLEEAYAGESPYVDTTFDGPGSYSYRIKSLYGENESSYSSVVTVFAGGAYDIPYTQDFATADSFNQFTVISTDSSYKWKYNSSNKAAGFDGIYSTYVSPTSSLITPALNLEAGKTYKVSAVAWVNSSSAAKDLKITAGADVTDAALAEIAKVNVSGLSSSKQTVEGYFAPETTGKYYFGFKGTAIGQSYYYLDDIVVEESIVMPAVVADLTYTPDAQGADAATIAFTIPVKSNAGVALTELTKVEVSRLAADAEEAEVVKVLEDDDCIPGAEVSFVDEVPEAGNYTYSVVSFLDDTASEIATSDTKWVGYDIPKALSTFSGMSLSLDDTATPMVKWGSLSGTVLGMNGGYVDAENLKYRVYRVDMLRDSEATLIVESDEHELYDEDIHDAEWSQYKYQISVLNGYQEGKATLINNSINGGKVMLPYQPNLTDDKLIDAYDGSGFIGDNGMVCKLKGETEGKNHRVYLPPFEAKDKSALKHSLTLSLSRHNGDYEELIEVYLHTIKADVVDQKADQAAAVIPGNDNETLISNNGQPISILSSSEEPAEEKVTFTLPATGRYRLSIKCVSPDNKGLTVHNLTLAAEPTTSVDEIVAAGNGISFAAGMLILPEDAVSVEVYTANGMKVVAADAAGQLNLSSLPAGFYVVRVATAAGETLTAKIVK